MKTPYSFSVLRYMHDPVSREFVNIGVIVYAPHAQFLQARCTRESGRVRALFGEIDRGRFRQMTEAIEDGFNRIGAELEKAQAFDPETTLQQLLAGVLPADDSGLQFSEPGAELNGDADRGLEQTLDELFERQVMRYATGPRLEHRTEEEA